MTCHINIDWHTDSHLVGWAVVRTPLRELRTSTKAIFFDGIKIQPFLTGSLRTRLIAR
jgi:hypothetical protein